MRADAPPNRDNRKIRPAEKPWVGFFWGEFAEVVWLERGPAGAVAEPRGRPEAVKARSAALRGGVVGLGKGRISPNGAGRGSPKGR